MSGGGAVAPRRFGRYCNDLLPVAATGGAVGTMFAVLQVAVAAKPSIVGVSFFAHCCTAQLYDLLQEELVAGMVARQDLANPVQSRSCRARRTSAYQPPKVASTGTLPSTTAPPGRGQRRSQPER